MKNRFDDELVEIAYDVLPTPTGEKCATYQMEMVRAFLDHRGEPPRRYTPHRVQSPARSRYLRALADVHKPYDVRETAIYNSCVYQLYDENHTEQFVDDLLRIEERYRNRG